MNNGINVRNMNDDSIGRGFDVHKREGRIRDWQTLPGGGWLVMPNRSETVVLRTKREAAFVLVGLASASYAEVNA